MITIEGIEGSGKSTQIKRLAARLKSYNIPVVSSKEPGGTNLCDNLRSILLKSNKGENWTAMAELMLFYADRAQHISYFIKPMLSAGKIIIMDRFDDSTKAYQSARGIDDDIIDQMSKIVLDDLQPYNTILLDIDPNISLSRAILRNKLTNNTSETRFDEEDLTFHKLVRNNFLNIAKDNSDRIVVVPAERSADIVEDMIWNTVTKIIQTYGYKII